MLDSFALEHDDDSRYEAGPILRARKRLEHALTTLSLAVEALREQAAPPIDLRQEVVEGFQREILHLKEENQKLCGLLTESEEQYEAIKTVTKTVSSRLNDSVERLKQILEA